ncbi:MAG TPA: hypothetical protein VF028_15015 [Actinomycetota bacterium]|nr:hypothetical protein [Actinomycetota bacterium]
MYTETIERVNYLPYWLKPGIRTLFRPWVDRADRKQLSPGSPKSARPTTSSRDASRSARGHEQADGGHQIRVPG